MRANGLSEGPSGPSKMRLSATRNALRMFLWLQERFVPAFCINFKLPFAQKVAESHLIINPDTTSNLNLLFEALSCFSPHSCSLPFPLYVLVSIGPSATLILFLFFFYCVCLFVRVYVGLCVCGHFDCLKIVSQHRLLGRSLSLICLRLKFVLLICGGWEEGVYI